MIDISHYSLTMLTPLPTEAVLKYQSLYSIIVFDKTSHIRCICDFIRSRKLRTEGETE